jgi:predicted aminopeptidase
MLSLLLATRPKCSAFQSTTNFPAADAEKAAEIDDGRAHYAGLSERRGLAAGPVIGM